MKTTINLQLIKYEWEGKGIRKVCPECNGNLFVEDTIHAEVHCRKCGLVLVAPPHYSFIPAGYSVVDTHRKVIVDSEWKSWRIVIMFD